MLTLGLHLSTRIETELDRNGFGMHDTAAVLVRDNVTIQQKNTDKVFVRTLKYCRAHRQVYFCSVYRRYVSVFAASAVRALLYP